MPHPRPPERPPHHVLLCNLGPQTRRRSRTLQQRVEILHPRRATSPTLRQYSPAIQNLMQDKAKDIMHIQLPTKGKVESPHRTTRMIRHTTRGLQMTHGLQVRSLKRAPIATSKNAGMARASHTRRAKKETHRTLPSRWKVGLTVRMHRHLTKKGGIGRESVPPTGTSMINARGRLRITLSVTFE